MKSPPDDVFEQLHALITPENLLEHPGANGDGVRVCVIDSGIERSVIEERCRRRNETLKPIVGGIFSAEQAEPLPYEGRQSTPHGTTVADIILSLAPRVELFSADVLGPRGSCEVDTLMRALQYAMDKWQCRVINLSLGVTEQRLQPVQRRNQLLRIVEDAYFNDVLIIAAAHNEHPFTRSYPAVLSPPILSVDKGTFAKPLDLAYRLRERIEFQAHSRGEVGPFAQEPATSWAAPHLTGIVARLLSLRPGMKPFEVKTLLYWLAQRDA